MAADTPVEQIEGIVKEARESFNAGISRPNDFRKAQLKGILRLVEDKKKEIVEAMYHDLGRHEQEAVLGEIVPGL